MNEHPIVIGPICAVCGSGGGWHYWRCEVGLERGMVSWCVKGGPLDMLHRGRNPEMRIPNPHTLEAKPLNNNKTKARALALPTTLPTNHTDVALAMAVAAVVLVNAVVVVWWWL